MDPKSWKQLRLELESLGYEVSLHGKKKNEYLCESPHYLVDIYRGGITGTGTQYEVFIYNVDNDNMEFHFTARDYKEILNLIESEVYTS